MRCIAVELMRNDGMEVACALERDLLRPCIECRVAAEKVTERSGTGTELEFCIQST